MAPLDFKHFTSVDYKPGEDDAIKYYAQKRKKQYHGNESVQSADKKPEKYIKSDGKVGIRMMKTDKEVIKKESSFGDNSFAARLIKIRNHPKVKAARKAHAAGEWDGNVDKEGEAVVHINGKPHTVTNKYGRKKTNEIAPVVGALARTAATSVYNKLTNKKAAQKESVELDEMFASTVEPHKDGYRPKVVKDGSKLSYLGQHVYKSKEHARNAADHIANAQRKGRASDSYINDFAKRHHKEHGMKESVELDEALNLQQRMKRSRLMKRMKSRIAVGRKRAMKKMANKKTIEKRALRQARNQIAQKLTRGIPKSELTFARKQEIEKRLAKPALQQRIKRIAKKLFKDVRKRELERKKG